MIIVGTGSAGKEAYGVYSKNNDVSNIVFFDENYAKDSLLYNKHKVITTTEELNLEIKKNAEFCIAIGNPRIRKKVFDKFIELTGIPKNISYNKIQSISDIIENASIFQPGVVISYDVKIGNSCIIHANSTIGHKVNIGNFVNISPLCSIIGPCTIGSETYIGAGSIILPNINIGKNVFIKPGSIVNKDLRDFETF